MAVISPGHSSSEREGPHLPGPPLPTPPFPPHRERRENSEKKPEQLPRSPCCPVLAVCVFPSPGEGGRVGSGEGPGVRAGRGLAGEAATIGPRWPPSRSPSGPPPSQPPSRLSST